MDAGSAQLSWTGAGWLKCLFHVFLYKHFCILKKPIIENSFNSRKLNIEGSWVETGTKDMSVEAKQGCLLYISKGQRVYNKSNNTVWPFVRVEGRMLATHCALHTNNKKKLTRKHRFMKTYPWIICNFSWIRTWCWSLKMPCNIFLFCLIFLGSFPSDHITITPGTSKYWNTTKLKYSLLFLIIMYYRVLNKNVISEMFFSSTLCQKIIEIHVPTPHDYIFFETSSVNHQLSCIYSSLLIIHHLQFHNCSQLHYFPLQKILPQSHFQRFPRYPHCSRCQPFYLGHTESKTFNWRFQGTINAIFLYENWKDFVIEVTPF